jgi:formamidopyrimidine-DNA glycosylase
VITEIERRGKQLAIFAGDQAFDVVQPIPIPSAAGCVCIHLGMTGMLRHSTQISGHTTSGSDQSVPDPAAGDQHIHLTWMLDDGTQLVFRDPRRFGGVWTFGSYEELFHQRWRFLGPDALKITAPQFRRAIAGRDRSVKAALLDQSIVAGVGNIYTDETLHRSGIHPARRCLTISASEVTFLVQNLKNILRRAIVKGGSSIRDYSQPDGSSGSFQAEHLVYGRSGRKCMTCGLKLCTIVLAGRSTVYCLRCQPVVAAGSSTDRRINNTRVRRNARAICT